MGKAIPFFKKADLDASIGVFFDGFSKVFVAIAGDFNPGIEDHRPIVRVLCQTFSKRCRCQFHDSVDPHEMNTYQCNRQRKRATAKKNVTIAAHY